MCDAKAVWDIPTLSERGAAVVPEANSEAVIIQDLERIKEDELRLNADLERLERDVEREVRVEVNSTP